MRPPHHQPLQRLFYDAVYDATLALKKCEQDISDVGDVRLKSFPMKSCSVRLRKALCRSGLYPKPTYGEILEFGREGLLETKNVGETTAIEVDDAMREIGLEEYWKLP